MATDRKVCIYPSCAAEPTGYGATYTSLSAMEAAENGDLTDSGGTRLVVEIVASDGSWSGSPDTTKTLFDGWTCDYASGEYVWIYTVGDAKPDYDTNDGWDSTAYVNYGTGGALDHNVVIDNDHAVAGISMVWEDIQFKHDTASAEIIHFEDAGHVGYVAFKRCWFWQAQYVNNVITETAVDLDDEILFQNCVFEGNASYNLYGAPATGEVWLVNCTGYKGAFGFESNGNDLYSVNTVAFWTLIGEWNGVMPSGYPLYCAGDLSGAVGTSGIDLTPSSQSTDLHTTFTDPDGNDYTLTGVTTVADIIATGVTNATESRVPLDDIRGSVRTLATPGLGAFSAGVYVPPAGGGGKSKQRGTLMGVI